MGRYWRVFATFAVAGMVRDMTFRTNFLIACISSIAWVAMNLSFYVLVFSFTPELGLNTGWSREPFFVFVATGLIINSIVQTFFMPSAEEFSEMVRSGGLDAVLVQPLDAQFLITCHRVDYSSLANGMVGFLLLFWSLLSMKWTPTPVAFLLYPLFVIAGVTILYSFIIGLAAATIFLGRNQSLYDFWFYITTFSRYPMEIYSGPWGTPLQTLCTFVLPILVVVNVPARLLARPFLMSDTNLAVWSLLAAGVSFIVSRRVFTHSIDRYRSASS